MRRRYETLHVRRDHLYLVGQKLQPLLAHALVFDARARIDDGRQTGRRDRFVHFRHFVTVQTLRETTYAVSSLVNRKTRNDGRVNGVAFGLDSRQSGWVNRA